MYVHSRRVVQDMNIAQVVCEYFDEIETKYKTVLAFLAVTYMWI